MRQLLPALPVWGLVWGMMAAASAAAKEPAVPPGLDPGGVAIALFGDGVDYTRPEIAKRLARDGEGDLIAWDFTDNDIRPYGASSRSTDDAAYIIAAAQGIRLVVVKEPAGNAAAVGHMTTFTIRTPARVIVWPDGNPSRADWPVLFQAAQRFQDRIFVVPAPSGGAPRKGTANIIYAEPDGGDRRKAALDTAVRTAKLVAAKPDITAAELRHALAAKR